MDLQHREIKLVKIVAWLLIDSGGELLLLLGYISLSTGQPPRDNVKRGSVPISSRHAIERFAREIQLPKAQRG